MVIEALDKSRRSHGTRTSEEVRKFFTLKRRILLEAKRLRKENPQLSEKEAIRQAIKNFRK